MLSARRLITVAALSAGALLVPLTGTAAAHVTVSAPGATQGGYTKLIFRAPTEKEVATTGLEIAMPAETPIASVRVKPKPGWTYEMVRTTLPEPIEMHGREITEVVSRIIWKTAGPGIGATEFDEFEVSAGPLPEVEQLVFPALQTYADGEVVRWIEETVEGAAEPEKPAPVLELAAAEGDAHGGDGDASGEETSVDTENAAATSDTGTDGLTLAALVVSGLALATALAALLRGRERRTA